MNVARITATVEAERAPVGLGQRTALRWPTQSRDKVRASRDSSTVAFSQLCPRILSSVVPHHLTGARFRLPNRKEADQIPWKPRQRDWFRRLSTQERLPPVVRLQRARKARSAHLVGSAEQWSAAIAAVKAGAIVLLLLFR